MSTRIQDRSRKVGATAMHWLMFALSLLTIGWISFQRQEDEMTRNHAPSFARAETSGRRAHSTVAGAFAVATMLLPVGAWGVDSTPRLPPDRAGYVLPLPPIPYLDSIRWMSWKPRSPLFKTDILLLPDNIEPGLFQRPSEQVRGLPRVS